MKLYILARKDAPIGKVMAHVGHVCCNMMNGSVIKNEWFYKYNQTKIILEVENQEELRSHYDRIFNQVHFSQIDMEQDIHTGEYYCLAIGPIKDDKAKELGLKRLRLFK